MIKSISLIIPTYNRRDYLANLLRCIKQRENNYHFQIIVVNDGSTDGTHEMLIHEFPYVIEVKGAGNWWYTKCLNEGLKYVGQNRTKPDYIFTLNDDTLLPKNYLTTLLKLMNISEHPILLGAVSKSIKNNEITFGGIKKINKLLFKYCEYTQEELIKLDCGLYSSKVLPTRGLLLPYDVVENIGGFDEKNFPQYGSDYDFVLRAKYSGFSSYITQETFIYEYPDLTSSGNPRLNKSFIDYLKQLFLNKYSSNYLWKDMLFVWKHGYKLLIPVYFALQLTFTILLFIKYNNK